MSNPIHTRDGRGPSPGTSDDSTDSVFLEYWRVLRERRRIVLSCLAITTVAALVASYLATPEYTARTTIEIERQSPEILEFTDVLNVDPSGYHDFYETQYKILQSRAVLRLAAERLDLMNRPELAGRRGSPIGRMIAWVRSFAPTTQIKRSTDPLRPAVQFIAAHLTVSAIHNSHLVRVAVSDRDPQLAADIANAVADAYQRFQLDARYSTTGKAKEFLAKDVALYQAEIGDLQRELQAYGVEKEILGFSDGTQDISERALADIDHRRNEGKARLMAAEARFLAVVETAPDGLPEVLQSSVITHLRQERALLERQQDEMARKFSDDWPPLLHLREKLRTADQQLTLEAEQIAAQVRAVAKTEYERAASEFEKLTDARDAQMREVQRVNLAAIQYASLKAQIDSKREVMADLVARQSETETSFRLKETSTSNIRTVDYAEPPTRPSRPRTMLNMVLAIMFGTVLGIGMAFFVDHLDNTVKTEQDIQRFGRLTVLGHVPLARSLRLVGSAPARQETDPTRRLDLASHLDPKSAFSEAFRNLRTSLLLATPDHPPQHVAITSCEPGDGKSTVACNLAMVFTQLGRKVLLVDADLRRPRIHTALEIPNAVGLSSFLSGNASLAELARETEVPNLSVITAGPIPPNPSELLGSARLAELLRYVDEHEGFDHVILDSPPVLSVTDAIVLSAKLDSTILVIRAGQTRREALEQSVSRLNQSHSSVIGSVLNGVSAESTYYYGRYGRHQEYYDENESGSSPTPNKQSTDRRAG